MDMTMAGRASIVYNVIAMDEVFSGYKLVL